MCGRREYGAQKETVQSVPRRYTKLLTRISSSQKKLHLKDHLLHLSHFTILRKIPRIQIIHVGVS